MVDHDRRWSIGRSIDAELLQWPTMCSSMPSAKWQAKVGNWHTKKYLDGQTKGTIVGQNILGLPIKRNSDGTQFFSYFMPCHDCTNTSLKQLDLVVLKTMKVKKASSPSKF